MSRRDGLWRRRLRARAEVAAGQPSESLLVRTEGQTASCQSAASTRMRPRGLLAATCAFG